MDYFFDFGIENYIENPEISIKFRSKSSVERPKQAKSVIFFDFSRKKIHPNFLRSGQSLLKRHNHPSSLSSLPIGLLHT